MIVTLKGAVEELIHNHRIGIELSGEDFSKSGLCAQHTEVAFRRGSTWQVVHAVREPISVIICHPSTEVTAKGLNMLSVFPLSVSI